MINITKCRVGMGVGCHFLLQQIFPTQGLNPGLPHCRQMLYLLSYRESPIPKKGMPKNVQTTAQLHSSHMLVKSCSKFSKPGFSNMWTMKFQMFKLDLEKAEESEIKLPTSAGSWKKQESSRKTSATNWKILQEMGTPDHVTCLLRNVYANQKSTVRTGYGTTDWFQIRKGVCQGCILSPCLFNLCRVHHEKCWTGWSTIWNQDCQEKYQ